MDPLNLILLIVVVIIGWRLRSVLGTRHDDEQSGGRADAYRLNADAFDREPSPEAEAAEAANQTQSPVAEPATEAAEGEVSAQGRGLAYLRDIDPAFDEAGFLDGAGRAYEMILTAFAEDDLSSVDAFLGSDVAEGFAAAIAERQAAGQKLDTRILRLDRPALDDARIEDGTVYLDVRLRAEIISFTHAADTPPHEEDLPAPNTTHDVWIFARPLDSDGPAWQLVATHAA